MGVDRTGVGVISYRQNIWTARGGGGHSTFIWTGGGGGGAAGGGKPDPVTIADLS